MTRNEAEKAFNSPQNVRLQNMGRKGMYIFLLGIIFSLIFWGTNLSWVGPTLTITALLLVIVIYPKLAPGPWEFPEEPVLAD